MSLQAVTLQTAVQMQVKEFAAVNRVFSVHDITTEIRQKVNSGALEIPETEVPNGGQVRFNIPHPTVKGLFDEMWRNGVFTPDFSLNRNFNGTYFEYTPQVTTPVVSAAPFGTVAPAPVASFSVSQPAVVAPTVTATTSVVTKKTIVERISLYLTNCGNRSFRPTLKQVQSAIKRGDVSTGWSCEDIKTIVENDLGFSVVADPNLVSASQVVV